MNNCKFHRRFGAETELNTTTGKIQDKNIIPDGSDLVGSLIRKVCRDNITLQGWQHINNNKGWVIKPDSTCGIEVNTPILKGGYDLLKLCKVTEEFKNHPKITADERCSFHVHVNYQDLTANQIGTILAWWVKCEGVLFDSIPAKRKIHRHTQLIGMSDAVYLTQRVTPESLIDVLSDVKYHSANVYHMRQKRRQSIEFRIAGNDHCLNPLYIKCWIRFLLHLSKRALKKGFPKNYKFGDPWTGLSWLNVKEVFDFLEFNDDSNLSLGMQQVKYWFIDRLKTNVNDANIGIWNNKLRKESDKQIREISKLHPNPFKNVSENTLLYSKDYLI